MLLQRLSRLLCVKSIVALLMSAVFSLLALRGDIQPQEFMTVFTVIIAFYFGTTPNEGRTTSEIQAASPQIQEQREEDSASCGN